MVFNLEVDAEHVYAVAADGVLVHNNCPISMDDALDLAGKFLDPSIPTRSVDGGKGKKGTFYFKSLGLVVILWACHVQQEPHKAVMFTTF